MWITRRRYWLGSLENYTKWAHSSCTNDRIHFAHPKLQRQFYHCYFPSNLCCSLKEVLGNIWSVTTYPYNTAGLSNSYKMVRNKDCTQMLRIPDWAMALENTTSFPLSLEYRFHFSPWQAFPDLLISFSGLRSSSLTSQNILYFSI